MGKYINKITLLPFLFCVTLFASFDSEGQRGVVRTISAKTYGQLSMNIGIGFNYAQDKEYIESIIVKGASSTDFYSSEYGKMLTGLLNLGLGLTSFLDIAGSLPLFYDKTGVGNGVRDAGIGDLSLSVKLLYPPPGNSRLFYQAYYLNGSIPSGNRSNGIFPRYSSFLKKKPMNGTFYTSDCFTLKPMMLWTFDIGHVVPQFQCEVDVNVGGLFSIDANRNNLILANLAMQYHPVEVVTLFVEWSMQSRWQNFEQNFKWGTDPVMLSTGLRLHTLSGLFVTLSGDFGLFNNYRGTGELWEPTHSPVNGWLYKTKVSPRAGFHFALGWKGLLTSKDTDNDGIKDEFDRCPKDAEDKDGYEDMDGCPEMDNDKDTIVDSKDKCPNEREDYDGFEDEDGCPDSDNDGDGIADIQDRCPRLAEDFDGIADGDGCPDNDNDKDGIQDSIDNCPNESEDKDGFEDEDGCSDPDNDRDGLPDLKDNCPNNPETKNGFEDEDGCPDSVESIEKSDMPKHQVLEGVGFSSGSETMTYSSYPFLESLIMEMKKYPSIEIEIRGHTDSIGKYETNVSLSQKRAESVKMHLIKGGISASRIIAVGFGPNSPIADNRTAAGRAKNRRIEILRTK